MSTLDELQQGVDFLDAAIRSLNEEAADRAFTEDEQTRFDEGLAERARLAAEHEALAQRHQAIAGLTPVATVVERGDYTAPNIIVRDENPHDLTDVRMGDAQAVRSKALSCIERDSVMADHQKVEAERVTRSLDPSVAARVALTSSDAYGSAFVKAVSGREHLFTDAERDAVERAVTLGGTAGYAVPAPIDTTIIDTGSHSANPFRQLATIKKITGTYWTGVSSAGVSASWEGEGDESADAAPTLAQPQIPTFKGNAFVPFSLEAEDWASMASDVYQMITVAKDDLEGAAFAAGNGSSAPQGVVTGLDGTASEIAPTVAETFTPRADLEKLIASQPARFRRNSVFVAEQTWYNAVRAVETTVNVGSLISTAPADAAGDQRLMGYRAYESSDMDAVLPNASADADNFGLIFGDLAQGYYIVDRVGLTVELIPHLFHTSNNLPKGQRGFYAWFRTGAEVVNIQALKMLSIPTAS